MLSRLLFSLSTFSLVLFTRPGNGQQTTFQLQLSRSAQEDVAAVIQNSSGNYVIATITYSSATSFDAGFLELSPSGTILQTKTISTTGTELIKSIIQTTDGGYLVTGSFFVTANDYDWMVMKLDASFNLTWYKRLGVSGANDNANRGFQTAQNRYCITGPVSLGGSTKPAVVMLNSSGTVINQGYLTTNQFASPDYRGRYLGNGQIGFTHLYNALTIVDTLCNVVSSYNFALGTFSTDVRKTAGGRMAFTAVGDYGGPAGSSLVVGVLNNSLTNLIHSVKFTSSGNELSPVEFLIDNGSFIIAANTVDMSSGSSSPLLIKTDSTGSLTWCKNYKPINVVNCQIKAVIKTSDNGYILAGRMSSGGPYSLLIAKLDSAGNSGCNTNPYVLTTSVISPVAVNPHTTFTGSITPLNALATSSPAITYTQNVICTTVGLPEPAEEGSVMVNPSLFTDGFYISHPGNEPAVMELYDADGRCVLRRTAVNREWIPAGSLSEGCYLFVLKSGKSVFRKKLMKTGGSGK